jgi:hypothetical protein
LFVYGLSQRALRFASLPANAHAQSNSGTISGFLSSTSKRNPLDRHRLASPGIDNMTDRRYHASRACEGHTLYGEQK